ncbi:hypothetical protein GCM10027413_24290 [Conyzicola nivalis]|uniref:Uncharacterized protein n=1 Tax=Conyzicola nivalis TaxID=1477021 RepID=A0A916SAK4_9MICO|nr:hypothetical protein GCM10010979_02330 [Conyzicola nivalis]
MRTPDRNALPATGQFVLSGVREAASVLSTGVSQKSYAAVKPPSTANSAPVMKLASSLSR